MKTIAPLPDDPEEEPPVQPLSAEEARLLRERHPPLSPWRVVVLQVLAGVLVAALVWGVTGRADWSWSLGYGVLAVAFPAALMARALTRRTPGRGAGAGFMAWELVKVGLTLVLLVAAPKVVPGLSWPALLLGVVLATKMYWVALAWLRRPRIQETS
jgi:ATP synthase protein I